MNPRRSLSVSGRIFMDLRNDRRTMVLIVLAPIFAMTVFGMAFSGSVEDVRVIIVNEDLALQFPAMTLIDTGITVPDGTPPTANITLSVSGIIISNMDRDVMDISYMNSLENAMTEVKEGRASGVIHFPRDMTRDTMHKRMNSSFSGNTTISLLLDKSNVNVAEAVANTVSGAMVSSMDDLGQEMPMTMNSEQAIYGQDAGFMDFFVPGIMSFTVYLLTTLITLLAFVGEKTSGTIDRMLATPLRESEIVTGYAIAFGLVGSLQAGFLLAIGVLLFDVAIAGSALLAFIIIALLAIACQALGILLSNLAKREAQAIQFIPFIILPAFLLGGVFWPIEAIPGWLRPFSYLVPIYYSIDASRSVMIRGWGPDMVWMDIAALIGFAVGFLALAVLTLKARRQ